MAQKFAFARLRTLCADPMTDLGWQAGSKAQELVVVRGDSYACLVLNIFSLSFSLSSFLLSIPRWINKDTEQITPENSQANHTHQIPASLENRVPACLPA